MPRPKKPAKRSVQVESAQPNPSGSMSAVPSVVNSQGELLKHRVRTAGDIQSAFMTLWTADQSSDYNRAIQQADIDGVPPFSQDGLYGQGAGQGRINVNWGFSRRMIEQHELPYTDLLDSTGLLFTLKTNYGTAHQKNFIEPLLAEGLSRTLRNWRPYTYLYQKRAQIFVREGLAICFYDDDNNWQWQVMGQQDMKFPREAIPCEDMLDCCGCKVDMLTTDLARYTKNKKIAEEEGWDCKAVEAALKKAKPRNQYIQNDYQHWQQKWKDNDVIWSTTAPVVETIHWWQRELDGSVSHYIAPFSEKGDILFKSEGVYERFSRVLTLFPYGIGTNGTLHSMRGQGSFGYQAGSAMNRVFCSYMEMAMHAATPVITCGNEDNVNDLPIRRQGPYFTLQNGASFAENHIPDFGDTLIPLFGLTSQIFQNNTQGGAGFSPTQSLERKTNMQERNEVAEKGGLSASQMALFFTSEERHLREVVRRMIRRNYRIDEPGGREVFQLREWLLRNGVPLESLYEIDVDSLEINMGIGRGSRMNRLNTISALMDDYYRFDRQAQNQLLNMKVAAVGNAQLANQLVPLEAGQRPGEQVQVAVDENGHLVSGNDIQISSVVILPDQDHEAHVMEAHIPFLQQLWPMTKDQNPMMPFQVISPLWEHAIAQWEQMNPDSPSYKEAKQTLREMGEWVTNTAKQLAAAQQRAELEGQDPQAAGEETTSTTTAQMHALDAEAKMADVAGARAKLDMATAQQAMKLNFETQRNNQKLAFERQKMNLSLAEKMMGLQAKVATERQRVNGSKQTA